MPMEKETERKTRQLEKGEGVKAPYSYWHNVLIPETKREYPDLSIDRIRQIAGKRWANISFAVKKQIIRKWQRKPRRIIRRSKQRTMRRR